MAEGRKNQEENGLLRRPGPHTREGQWPHPAISRLGPQYLVNPERSQGQEDISALGFFLHSLMPSGTGSLDSQ